MTLIVYTVNTGMLTAIDAAAGMITYAVMPTNLVFLAFYLNLSKRASSVQCIKSPRVLTITQSTSTATSPRSTRARRC